MSGRRALWVSTSMETRGGAATYVRTMQRTPLWDQWQVRHVATHRNGSVAVRVAAFIGGATAFGYQLIVRRPAVVHLHSSSYGSFARKSLLAWISHFAKIPTVLHVHGGGFHEFYSQSPRWVQHYIRVTLEGADRVIALGDRWAAALQQIAPDARIVVVSNAVQPRTPVDQPESSEPVHVLFLGDVEDHKGAFLLLEAWGQLVDGPLPAGADLVMAGDGAVARAQARAKELGISDRVRLTGWVDPAAVENLLSGSHILALPSQFEGQPMAVLEAMAHGLCVVATDVGGIPDLVGDCGLLVPVDDLVSLTSALRLAISDSERRATLGSRAYGRVQERFDVNVTWKALNALYEELSR